VTFASCVDSESGNGHLRALYDEPFGVNVTFVRFCACAACDAFHASGSGMPASSRRRSTTCVSALDLSTLDPNVLYGSAAAILVAGGGAYGLSQKDKGSSATAAAVVEKKPPPPAAPPPPRSWAPVGGTAGAHRMAGTMPAPPPRELWTPPPGWEPPRFVPPVRSWYDSGVRLQPASAPEPPAAPAAPPKPTSPAAFFDDFAKNVQGFFDQFQAAPSPPPPKVWLPVGGKAGAHRMAGTMGPPPPRELWKPPPGWEPPKFVRSEGVQSWFDAGKRLASE